MDSRTQRLLAQVVAYNPELRLFSSAIVAFEFGKGGSVQVASCVPMSLSGDDCSCCAPAMYGSCNSLSPALVPPQP